jgi:Fe2+ transport system protein FeoA
MVISPIDGTTMHVLASHKRLDELEPYECAIVVGVDGDDDDLERLKSMGVCDGRNVQVTSCGDPLVLKVYGTRLGVSARLARCVRVSPCIAESCGH